MAEKQTAPAGLRRSWSALRVDVPFLPKPDQLIVDDEHCELQVVEFVRVAPVDEEVMVPVAAEVTTDPVETYPGWSDAAEDQQRMWALVDSAIEGSRRTCTCPDCGGSKWVTCSWCHGHGRVTCSACGGGGRVSCFSCGGSGHHERTTTATRDGQTVTETIRETCGHCGGSGSQTCGT
jgi:hypothetical protein